MKQMNVPEKIKIPVDFDDKSLSEAVRTLQPLVFKDGKTFCCVLGPNRMRGIFGCGPSLNVALDEWESNMRKRIIYPQVDDYVVRFVQDKLNTEGVAGRR